MKFKSQRTLSYDDLFEGVYNIIVKDQCREWNFDDCGLNDENFYFLLKILETIPMDPSIGIHFSFKSNEITVYGVEYMLATKFAKTPFESLYFDDNKIENEGIELLLDNYKETKVFGFNNVNGSDAISSNLAKSIKENLKLMFIKFANNQLTDIGNEEIVKVYKEQNLIVPVDLRGNHLSYNMEKIMFNLVKQVPTKSYEIQG